MGFTAHERADDLVRQHARGQSWSFGERKTPKPKGIQGNFWKWWICLSRGLWWWEHKWMHIFKLSKLCTWLCAVFSIPVIYFEKAGAVKSSFLASLYRLMIGYPQLQEHTLLGWGGRITCPHFPSTESMRVKQSGWRWPGGCHSTVGEEITRFWIPNNERWYY